MIREFGFVKNVRKISPSLMYVTVGGEGKITRGRCQQQTLCSVTSSLAPYQGSLALNLCINCQHSSEISCEKCNCQRHVVRDLFLEQSVWFLELNGLGLQFPIWHEKRQSFIVLQRQFVLKYFVSVQLMVQFRIFLGFALSTQDCLNRVGFSKSNTESGAHGQGAPQERVTW